jgi:DNA-binding winged helix-turn-helix (wHTH) protein
MRLIGRRGLPSSNRDKKLIAELRDQLEQAQETILRLNELLQAQGGNLYRGVKLTRNQQTVVDILLATSGICSKESLCAALYASRRCHKPKPKTIRETISSIRKQLELHGIYIETVFNRGYIMNDETKDKLRELMLY